MGIQSGIGVPNAHPSQNIAGRGTTANTSDPVALQSTIDIPMPMLAARKNQAAMAAMARSGWSSTPDTYSLNRKPTATCVATGLAVVTPSMSCPVSPAGITITLLLINPYVQVVVPSIFLVKE